jgi:hypothetical protein
MMRKSKKQIKKYWKKIKKIYQWEEYIRTPKKLLKTGWGRSNIHD